MMSSFLKTLLIVLTFKQIVINCQNTSDFCEYHKSIYKIYQKSPRSLMFIPTSNGQYLYLAFNLGIFVYKFDTDCNYGQKCPDIGQGMPLTEWTDNKLQTLSSWRYPFIHNGITYLYGRPSDNDRQKVGIKMYGNGTNDWIYKSNEFLDKSIKSYAICYLWKTNKTKDPGLIPNSNINKPSEFMIKNILSIFVPPFEPYLPIGSIPRYGFSFDKTEVNDITVEVTGNYPKVDIVYDKRPYLYTFGDYIVPCMHRQYMLFPNGDAIATVDIGGKETDESKYDIFYFRSDPTGFRTISSVDLLALFGCDDKQIQRKTLKDYETDNIYSYFNKN